MLCPVTVSKLERPTRTRQSGANSDLLHLSKVNSEALIEKRPQPSPHKSKENITLEGTSHKKGESINQSCKFRDEKRLPFSRISPAVITTKARASLFTDF